MHLSRKIINMQSVHTRTQKHQTILYSLFFLFFIQLYGIWIESIYRICLLTLSMGTEMSALLFVLAPFILFLFPASLEKSVLKSACFIVLLTRLLCPFFGVVPSLIITGIGLGASLILISYALSDRYRLSGSQAALAIAYAVFISIALRAWGSTIDISTQGKGVVIGFCLVAIAAFLLCQKPWPAQKLDTDTPAGKPIIFLRGIGIFANILILYLILMTPAVISAWSEANYLLITILVLVSWILALHFEHQILRKIGSLAHSLWNIAFIFCLVAGILIHTPDFPATVDAPVFKVYSPSQASLVLFYFMCILSPVTYFNLSVLLERPLFKSPRATVLPVFVGTIFLVAMTMCHIFTNVWSYVGPLGFALRGKFYLPFLIAGVMTTLSIIFVNRRGVLQHECAQKVKRLILILSLLAIAGVLLQNSSPSTPSNTKKELTILTYNMRLGSAMNGDRSYKEQLELIKQINPDIIGLQESDTPRPSGWNVDIARYYADALDYHMYVGPTAIGGTFGTAILSRYPIKNSHTIYSYSTADEVGTAIIEVEVGGRRIAFFNSHPAGGGSKKPHVDALIEEASNYDYVIAVGDYNSRQDTEWYAILANEFKDSWLAVHPSAIGDRHPSIALSADESREPLDMTNRIDHIFVSDSFQVKESYYVPVPESMTDHPAHWSIISWE